MIDASRLSDSHQSGAAFSGGGGGGGHFRRATDDFATPRGAQQRRQPKSADNKGLKSKLATVCAQ